MQMMAGEVEHRSDTLTAVLLKTRAAHLGTSQGSVSQPLSSPIFFSFGFGIMLGRGKRGPWPLGRTRVTLHDLDLCRS